jgi:predicted small secreted protein
MKLLVVMAVALALNSCNTCIGLGRDTVQGYKWTKSKIQGTQSDDSAGAPVY